MIEIWCNNSNKLLHIFQGHGFQKCPLSRPYDSKEKQNPYQLNMLMSILNNLNNRNKQLQFDSSETTKLVPMSNQDVSYVEPRKKCKLRKFLLILLLIIGSGLATYVHIYSLSYGWKQITKVAALIGENSGKLKNHIQRKLEDYDKLWSGTVCSFTTFTL